MASWTPGYAEVSTVRVEVGFDSLLPIPVCVHVLVCSYSRAIVNRHLLFVGVFACQGVFAERCRSRN